MINPFNFFQEIACFSDCTYSTGKIKSVDNWKLFAWLRKYSKRVQRLDSTGPDRKRTDRTAGCHLLPNRAKLFGFRFSILCKSSWTLSFDVLMKSFRFIDVASDELRKFARNACWETQAAGNDFKLMLL